LHIITVGNYAPSELPGQFRELVLRVSAAQGIAAESPQEAHRRFRGLEAESPVFLPAHAGKKMRQNSFVFVLE
jgi:hypothetical protein